MNTTVGSGAKWFALEFCSARYNNVFNYLNTLEASWYCPMKVVVHQRPGRINSYKVTKAPLFPGYLFIKIDFDKLHTSTITKHQHIRRFLSFGKEPVPVNEETIEIIKERDAQYVDGVVDLIDGAFNAKDINGIIEIKDPKDRTQCLINYICSQSLKLAH